MKMPKDKHILFVATCAPRPCDPRLGSFVHDMAVALRDAGAVVTVLVPVRVFPDMRLLQSMMHPFRLRALLRAFRDWIRLWYGVRGRDERDGVRYIYFRFFTWPRTSRCAGNGRALTASIRRWWPHVTEHLTSLPDVVVGHFLDMAPLVHAVAERTGACRALYVHESPLGLAASHKAPWLLGSVSKLDLLFTNSRWNLAALNGVGFRASQNLAVSPYIARELNVIDGPDVFTGDVLRLVYVARFSSNKGHVAIVDAVEAWSRESRKPKLHVTFLGDHGAALSSLEQRLQLGGHVSHFELRTFCAVDDLVDVFSRADAFLSASHYESFGMALLEAASIGIPLITSENAGFVQALLDANYGVHQIDPFDIESVMSGIEALVNHNAARMEEARAIKQYVCQTYTPQHFAEGLLDACSAIPRSESEEG